MPREVGGRERPAQWALHSHGSGGERARCAGPAVLTAPGALALEAPEGHLRGSAQARPAPPLPAAQELGRDASPSGSPHNGSRSMIHRAPLWGPSPGVPGTCRWLPDKLPGCQDRARGGLISDGPRGSHCEEEGPPRPAPPPPTPPSLPLYLLTFVISWFLLETGYFYLSPPRSPLPPSVSLMHTLAASLAPSTLTLNSELLSGLLPPRPSGERASHLGC